jgi:predicted Zn finger-like uncharacterized protein
MRRFGMIIQCQSCAAKYFLPEERVPVDPLKVRCPKCRAVFMLAGRRERIAVPEIEVAAAAEAAAPTPAAPVFETFRRVEAPAAPLRESPAAPVMEAPAAPVMEAPAAPVMEAPVAQAVVEEAPAPAVVEAPAAEPARSARPGKSSEDRAKRLARVLVSDILWYNRERRDAALRDGTLMTSLGEEIKKSWELYKDKVGPEAAHSTNYFKEALNEILADGQQVF